MNCPGTNAHIIFSVASYYFLRRLFQVLEAKDPPVFLTEASELSGRYGTGEEIQLSIKVENPEESQLDPRPILLSLMPGVVMSSIPEPPFPLISPICKNIIKFVHIITTKNWGSF